MIPGGSGPAEGVRVTRHPDDPSNHDIRDVTVITQLDGGFEACYRTGANDDLTATDTQRTPSSDWPRN